MALPVVISAASRGDEAPNERDTTQALKATSSGVSFVASTGVGFTGVNFWGAE